MTSQPPDCKSPQPLFEKEGVKPLQAETTFTSQIKILLVGPPPRSRLDMYNEENHAAEAQARTQQGHDRPSQGSGFNNV